jgi:hypothetical protein
VVADIPRNVEGDIDMRYLGVVRSLRYPGGEVWRASIVDDNPDAPLVLRFSSESHTIDVTDWPNDWADLTNAELVALMQKGRSSFERRRRERPPSGPDDHRSDSGAR